MEIRKFLIRLSLRQRYFALLLVVLALIVYHFSRSQVQPKMERTEGLRADTTHFTLEKKPFRILGGSIHYFRVPRAYWKDRLMKMKACGLNTLTTYVPWNLHEPEQGVFDFEGELDLEAFLRIAASLELWVILRPGPYICAEWDLGGLPSWLLRDERMTLRTTYQGFTDAVNVYFDHLLKKVVPYQYSRDGPIIAVQVENEYGSYATDRDYMTYVKEALLSRGITELLLTSDNKDGGQRGAVAGALATVNLQRLDSAEIGLIEQLSPNKPKMVMEYWTGWFDLWGPLHHVFPIDDMMKIVTEILERDMSINLYMFHGGTNFGFMSGSFAVGRSAPEPMVTSYDYDAPLSEAGDYTAKYHALRTLFSNYHSKPLPDLPSITKKKAYHPITMREHLSLWNALEYTEMPSRSEWPLSMENLSCNNHNGQSYGYTLYKTTITNGGELRSLRNVRDRALVFVEKQFIGVLDYKDQHIPLPDGTAPRTLSLLVENLGRVNYGDTLDYQHKGLVGSLLLNSQTLRDFEMYCLDMKPAFVNKVSNSNRWKSMKEPPTFPSFFRASLPLRSAASDTFVKLPGSDKGVVFVNGRNLGRYWCIGPQQTLYLPAPWLSKWDNEIIVFEEEGTDGKVEFKNSPDLGMTMDVQ